MSLFLFVVIGSMIYLPHSNLGMSEFTLHPGQQLAKDNATDLLALPLYTVRLLPATCSLSGISVEGFDYRLDFDAANTSEAYDIDATWILAGPFGLQLLLVIPLGIFLVSTFVRSSSCCLSTYLISESEDILLIEWIIGGIVLFFLIWMPIMILDMFELRKEIQDSRW
jgi:hypothetical protein